MTSADFAAAQQRVLKRRQLRISQETQIKELQNQQSTRAITRLPTPFQGIAKGGLDTWNLIKGREGTRPAFRVGQVDAELLDEELLALLNGQVGEALKYFGVRVLIQ